MNPTTISAVTEVTKAKIIPDTFFYWVFGALLLVALVGIIYKGLALYRNREEFKKEFNVLNSQVNLNKKDCEKAIQQLRAWKVGRQKLLGELWLETAGWGAFITLMLWIVNVLFFGTLVFTMASYVLGLGYANLLLRILIVITNNKLGYGMEVIVEKGKDQIFANFDISGIRFFKLHGECYGNFNDNVSWFSFFRSDLKFSFRTSLIGRRLKGEAFMAIKKLTKEELQNKFDKLVKIIESNKLFVTGIEFNSRLHLRGKVVPKESSFEPTMAGLYYKVEIEAYSRDVSYDGKWFAQTELNRIMVELYQ